MSDMAGGAGAAPVGGAPSAPAAPSTPATSGGAPASGAAPSAAPAREPTLWRPDGLDRDIDVNPFLDRHTRKITVDGREMEVDVESAFRAAALEPAARKAFSEADRKLKAAQGIEAQMKRVDAAFNDPQRALVIAETRWGTERFELEILRKADEILRLKDMPPAERQAYEQRRLAQRKLEEDRSKIESERAEIERDKNEQLKAKRAATTARIKREWPPMLKSLGVPKGFIDDAMRSMVADLNEAQKRKVGLTEKEAAQHVAAQIRRKLGSAATPAPTAQSVAEQPGRKVPEAQPSGPRPRSENGQFRKGPLRPDDIRNGWRTPGR